MVTAQSIAPAIVSAIVLISLAICLCSSRVSVWRKSCGYRISSRRLRRTNTSSNSLRRDGRHTRSSNNNCRNSRHCSNAVAASLSAETHEIRRTDTNMDSILPVYEPPPPAYTPRTNKIMPISVPLHKNPKQTASLLMAVPEENNKPQVCVINIDLARFRS
ncbi:hypothetical protein BX070DRAFT_54229 [Coemansia spiralis]|nr:hypothetical protein BX070DRAFT_54229 [Coemansia spiralis]